MKKAAILGVGFAFAAMCAVELGAQTSTATTTSESAQPASTGSVTMTGCLQRADPSRMPNASTTTTGTTGTSGSSSEQFVLVNARFGDRMTSASSGANGQSSGGIASGATASGSSRGSNGGAMQNNRNRTMPYDEGGPWFVVTGDKDELRSAEGHQVEITGTVEPSASASGAAPTGTTGSTASGATTTTTTTTTDAAARSAHKGARVAIASIKVINPTCSE